MGSPSPFGSGIVRVCDELSTENDVKTGEEQFDLRARDPAHRLLEQRPVEGDHLRHVGDRVFRQTCHS